MPKAEIIKRPIDHISDNLKKSAWSAILESLITMILGILLIAWPDIVIKVVAYVVGIFLIVKGAYQIINYFIIKGQNDFFNNSLLAGVISALIGLTLLLIGEEIANVFRIVIGVWMIYESLVRINTSIKLHAANISTWKYTLIFALMMLVLGVFVTFYNGAVLTLIGWMMILAGLIGILGDIMFIQHVNNIIETLNKRMKTEQ
ncbi:DUF308 domain-containing protein [Candidatus Saccharibacteria bacterium]|nr:DUF308 domain-containing protein [Candidatus Saccharibacteria bacterium]